VSLVVLDGVGMTPSVETRLVIEEFENQKRGWCCTVSLAEVS
jgi:hypothetical protein